MERFKKIANKMDIGFIIKCLCIMILLLNVGITLAYENTGLIKDSDNQLLLVSTLDGFFICVERKSGLVRWKFKEEPIIRIPSNSEKSGMPFFLPDPKDGSLYMLNSNDREALSKLPFTIPQLVASSPCRSSDGIIFTGKKLDTWFTVNPENGVKRPFLSYDLVDLTCPKEGPDIYIGRTEYNIIMLDPLKNKKALNVTFYDYYSSAMDAERMNDYDVLHFTGSSSGRILTLDRETGSLLWQLNCDSAVIGVYILEARGLLKVPFTSLAEATLDQLIDEGNQRKHSNLGIEFKANELKFFPTLYVGECLNGLYAFSSLVDENTATLALVHRGPLLIEGPTTDSDSNDGPKIEEKTQNYKSNFFEVKELNFSFTGNNNNNSNNSNSNSKAAKEELSIILFGHYKMPKSTKVVLQIEGKSGSEKLVENESRISDAEGVHVGIQTEDDEKLKVKYDKIRWIEFFAKIKNGNFSILQAKEFLDITITVMKYFVMEQENLEIKVAMVTLVLLVLSMGWYLNKQMKDIQQLSQSSKSRDSSLPVGVTAVPQELGLGVVKVGKIEFNSEEILGKGCEGTFVFKGKFDNRSVAVKRILPECFTFADREVELLRESDHHPNVVRYYCMEQDKQFRYLALELCAATVQDYIEGKFKTDEISSKQILYEAMCGLKHLHSLSIVHRDIKPHNVLISMPTAKNEVRAMISDFGLCKKLKLGKTSFSRQSGITGTEGWIAPEMLNGEARTTCAVDIFSMGCVFYYVLSKGKHAFGDALHRQANILSGEYTLNHIDEENKLAVLLVERMIDLIPLNRPSANAILQHPIFWKNSKILSFLQDVSDRIEKENTNSVVLQKLEENRLLIVKGDWRSQIDSEVAEDLRKFRNYRGNSVRDLLRALRNKKHHYRELPEKAQKKLGDIPENFINYWTSRFPLLLIHTWLAMQTVKDESVFGFYYDNFYNFPSLPKQDYNDYTINSNDFPVTSNNVFFSDSLDRDLTSNVKEDTAVLNSDRRENTGGSAVNWRNEPCNIELEDLVMNSKSSWFQKWLKSDFRDDEAYIKWREEEYLMGKTNNFSFSPEPPSSQLRQKFRKLLLENSEDLENYNSPKKNKAKKYFQKRFNKKKVEEKTVMWTLPV